MAYRHTPVLLQEVLRGLNPQPGQHFVDGTVGGGGHAAAILQATSPSGQLIGFDRDAAAISAARANLKRFGSRVTLVHDSYANLAQHLADHHTPVVQGVLLDLGLSSAQLADEHRGFSFQAPSPLDLRFDERQPETAAHLLNTLPEAELAHIFRDYGDEPRAVPFARAIVEQRRLRPFRTTTDLLEVVTAVLGRHGRRSFNPATLVWQALRIAVNHELDELARGLAAARDALTPGGRLAVISFHSGEDRIVKEFVRHESRDCLCPPELPVCRCGHHAALRSLGRLVAPTMAEVTSNPRSRSAKLRLAEKLP